MYVPIDSPSCLLVALRLCRIPLPAAFLWAEIKEVGNYEALLQANVSLDLCSLSGAVAYAILRNA